MTRFSSVIVRVGRFARVVTVLILGSRSAGFAQGGDRPYAPGELYLSVQTGTNRSTVDALAAKVGATVLRNIGTVDSARLQEVYHLRMPNATQVRDTDTIAAITSLRADNRAMAAHPVWNYKRLQSTIPSFRPNDTLFPRQWDKVMMRLPEAWVLERGSSQVTVAIIDDGVDVDHPDIAPRFYKGLDAVNGTNNPRPILATNTHGTHVAGIAIALGNNGQGIAGSAIGGCRLFAIKISDASGGLSGAAITSAYQALIAEKAANPSNPIVVNMSYGRNDLSDTPDPLDPQNQLILTMARNGIICVPGAGNGFQSGNTPFNPANMASQHENIICVTGVNDQGTRTSYSQARPYSTIAAPGGDFSTGQAILSTWPLASTSTFQAGYEFSQGTSMAAPQVTGVVGLILSVPGVRPDTVKGLITRTARRVAGALVPSPDYGFGIIDAYAALLEVAISVTVVSPDGTGGKASASGLTTQPLPSETLRPMVKFSVGQVPSTALTISVNGSVVPPTDYTVSNVTLTGPAPANVPLKYDVTLNPRDFGPGNHSVEISGTATGRTVTDTRNFTVTPYQVRAGRSLISIPYVDAAVTTPEGYFGTNFKLTRWVPSVGQYAFYTSFGAKDPNASFAPSDFIARVDGTATPLVGLAFWSDSDSAKPIITRGAAVTGTVVIPLRSTGSASSVSWNMIGCPFAFDVPFNSLLVDTPKGRLTIAQAADAGYLLPNIYSYDAEQGYTFRTLPDGALKAWSGHWVGITTTDSISLVIPPSGSRAAKFARSATSVNDGWRLQIGARAGKYSDANNFVGVSSAASNGYDLRDVAKPPMPNGYVSVGSVHQDWGGRSGVYSQDLRQTSNASWTVVVDTDQKDSDVVVNWNINAGLPRGLQLSIKDESNGSVVDMRSRSYLTFRSAEQGARRTFTVTSRLSPISDVRITNVSVRSNTRATGAVQVGFTLSGDATYEVAVLSSTGNTVKSVASRAASAGNVQLVWDGKDAGGRSVSTGSYLVQIRAVTSQGNSLKVVQPFTIVR